MKHIHCDLIKAWADGAKIQSRGSDGVWDDAQIPMWFPDMEYRIKPTPRYRVALVKLNSLTDYFTITTNSPEDSKRFEESDSFVKWLTDWVEVEL